MGPAIGGRGRGGALLGLSIRLVALAPLAACGARSLDAGPARVDDAALALAEALPGASGCAAARLAELPGERRAGMQELSQMPAVVLRAEAPVVAAAMAVEGAGVAARSVLLVRTSAPEPEVRAFFDAADEPRLVFGADPSAPARPEAGGGPEEGELCEAGICRPVRIDFPEPTLLRIRQGELDGARPRLARCGELLRELPHAIEVGAFRDPVEAEGARASAVRAIEHVLEPEPDGLRVARVERYATPRFAATAARLQTVLPPEGGWLAVADPIVRVAVEDELRFSARVRYRDLALRARDVAGLRRATVSETSFAWKLVPTDAIDLRRFDVVDRQVYVREQRLGDAPPGAIDALARDLVALVDRALAVHPEQERIAEVRFHVLLHVLEDARAAASAAAEGMTSATYDREAWRARFREALLGFDLDAAGVALEDAGVAPPRRGRAGAAALRSLCAGAGPGREDDLPYALAEAAYAGAERLVVDGAARTPEALPEPVSLDWQALAETAVALLEIGGASGRGDRLIVVVEGPLPPGDEAASPFVELAAGDGLAARRFALEVADERGAIRAFGRALRAASAEGATTTLRFTLVAGDGARRPEAASIALRGRNDAHGLVVEAASGPTAEWGRVARLLAEPFDRMHAFARPPQSFAVSAVTADERRAILAGLGGYPGILCAPVGAGLACRAELAGATLRRAWAGAVRPLLVP